MYLKQYICEGEKFMHAMFDLYVFLVDLLDDSLVLRLSLIYYNLY